MTACTRSDIVYHSFLKFFSRIFSQNLEVSSGGRLQLHQDPNIYRQYLDIRWVVARLEVSKLLQ